MENYQKVEQLVNKTGCSYEEAKTALEACGWDMLDAVISLERKGILKKETAEHKEASADNDDVITAEVISVSSGRAGDNKDEAGKKGGAGKSGSGNAGAKGIKGLWNRFKRVVMNNRMVILKSNGQQMADLPIIVPIIALITFFWATLGLAVIAMIFGCRFHFEGENLGKTNINDTMDKATDYAEKVRNDLSGKANGEQNTDN